VTETPGRHEDAVRLEIRHQIQQARPEAYIIFGGHVTKRKIELVVRCLPAWRLIDQLQLTALASQFKEEGAGITR
jgi:hypothetical protein